MKPEIPHAPSRRGEERADQWGRLYASAHTLVASIGYMGEIDSRADEVASLMDALHDLDGGQWMPGLTPAAVAGMSEAGPARPRFEMPELESLESGEGTAR